jgi:uncharacterized protein (DUF58 family)
MTSLSVSSVQAKKSRRSSSSTHGVAHTSRSSSLTLPGFLFVFVTLFLALGAINGQNNLLFWLFGFSIAALIVSGIITGNALMHIRMTASHEGPAQADQQLNLRYTLLNTSRLLPNFALEVHELDVNNQSEHEPGVVVHIRPSARLTCKSTLVPLNRGYIELAKIRVRTRFPFGLFTKTIYFDIPRKILVYPKQIKLEQSNLDAMIKADESANRSLNRRGTGLDYFALRQYQPGDPIKTIAWKRSARSTELLVTEFPDPTSDQIQIQLAPPNEQVSDDQFETAISLAYTIMVTASKSTRIGLSIPWAAIDIHPSRGRAHVARCSRALALLERSASTRPYPNPRRNQRTVILGYDRKNTTVASLYAEDFIEEHIT